MHVTKNRLWLLLVLTFAPLGMARADARPETIVETSRRVVKIFGAGGVKGLYGYSTGFLVSPHGHIATVWSHVLDGPSATVVLHDGRKFEARVLGAEPQLDLAVLKIDADDLPCFDLAVARDVAAGSSVLAFSNMFKVAVGDEPVSVMHGVIAARTRLTARRGHFETPYTGPVYVVDAITNNPGSGGGVLTTLSGEIVGMIGKELRNSLTNTWINYAVPIRELKPAIDEIIAGRFVARKDPPRESAGNIPRYLPLDFGLVLVPEVLFRTPAFIDSIVPGSAADKAGLQPNDLILFVSDELVPSCRALRQSLVGLEAGDQLRLVVRRGNTLISVELPVEKKIPSEPPAETGGAAENDNSRRDDR